MNLLLDTHTLIWALENNQTLSHAAREVIVDGHNLVFVSAVSIWEISIKRALGKLKAPDNVIEEVNLHRFTHLSISLEHSDLAGRLPPLHQDPFDRMLIAQATLERLTIITRDENIHQYRAPCITA